MSLHRNNHVGRFENMGCTSIIAHEWNPRGGVNRSKSEIEGKVRTSAKFCFTRVVWTPIHNMINSRRLCFVEDPAISGSLE